MNLSKPLFCLFMLSIIISCGGDEDTNGIDTRHYFTGEIDGTQIQIQHGDTDFFTGSESSENGNNFCIKGYSSAISSFGSTTGPFLAIDFENLLFFNQSCTNEIVNDAFPTAFQVEAYPFDANLNTEKFIVISYLDENNVSWDSRDDDQSSAASFEVIESALTTSTRYFSNQIVEVKCRFSCTLYNDNNESIELKNGEAFYLYFNE